jgi:hypothetical protein
MGELGDGGEELGVDRFGAGEPVRERRALGVDERVRRLKPGIERRGHEILPLADEQPQALACAPGLELAHELEARVRGGGDHPAQLSQEA